MDDTQRGREVIARRKLKGWTQEEAARQLGWSQQRLGRVETGKGPTIQALTIEDAAQLERVLGVPVGLWFAAQEAEAGA